MARLEGRALEHELSGDRRYGGRAVRMKTKHGFQWDKSRAAAIARSTMKPLAKQFTSSLEQHDFRVLKADCPAKCAGNKKAKPISVDLVLREQSSGQMTICETKWSRDGAQRALMKAESEMGKLRSLIAGSRPTWLTKDGRLDGELELPCKLAAFGLGPTDWRCNFEGRSFGGALGQAPVKRKRARGDEESARDPEKRAASRALAEAKRKGQRSRRQSVKRRPSGASNWAPNRCAGCAYKDGKKQAKNGVGTHMVFGFQLQYVYCKI
jgi:hypothetical protein